jgi:hypothetical protein
MSGSHGRGFHEKLSIPYICHRSTDRGTRRAMRRTSFFSTTECLSKRGVPATRACNLKKKKQQEHALSRALPYYLRRAQSLCGTQRRSDTFVLLMSHAWRSLTRRNFGDFRSRRQHDRLTRVLHFFEYEPLYSPIAHTAQGRPNDAAMGLHNSRL